LFRQHFPPTEYDLKGEEWEEVEGGESAENGASQEQTTEDGSEVQTADETAKIEDMPDVPTETEVKS
jgi:hypothetical protein